MNTLVHLAAVLTTLWASVFAFQTLEETALGGGLLALFFFFVALTINAIDDDVFLAFGKRIFGFKGDERRALSFSSIAALVVTLFMLAVGLSNHLDSTAKWMLRVPEAGETRANFHVGGSAKRAEISTRDREICDRLRPALLEYGILFAGIDVIGDWLTEVNVTSPTGIREINALDGVRLEEAFLDRVEKRSAPS